MDLGVLIVNAAGIGYALRYGIIEPNREALDSVVDTDAYRELAEKGFGAEQANMDLPTAAIKATHKGLRAFQE